MRYIYTYIVTYCLVLTNTTEKIELTLHKESLVFRSRQVVGHTAAVGSTSNLTDCQIVHVDPVLCINESGGCVGVGKDFFMEPPHNTANWASHRDTGEGELRSIPIHI